MPLPKKKEGETPKQYMARVKNNKEVQDFLAIGQTAASTAPRTAAEEFTTRRRGHALGLGEADPADTYSEEMAVGALRYGIPGALALTTGGLGLPAAMAIETGVVGATGFAAQHLEDFFADSDSFNKLEKVKDQLVVGGKEALYNMLGMGILRGVAKGTHAIARKIMLPETMPLNIETVQALLGKLSKGKKSLTFGQLNMEERNFIHTLESVARSGYGSEKVMRKFDLRNLKTVGDFIQDYIEERSKKMTGNEFGAFLQKILGTTDEIGEAFHPVEAMRKMLYRESDNFLVLAPDVDATNLLKYFRQSGKQAHVKRAWARINQTDVIDPDTGKTLSLLPSLEDDAAWKAIDVSDIDEALKRANKFARQVTHRGERATLKYVASQFKKHLDKSLKQVPGAKEARTKADAFFASKEVALYNKTVTGIRKAIENKPEVVRDLFKGRGGYSTLMRTKEALRFSSKTAGTAPQFDSWWKDHFIKPLRHSILSESVERETGNLSGAKLAKALDSLAKHGDELPTEIFGDIAKPLRDAATTIKLIGEGKFGEKIFIQLVQGGIITGVLAGLASPGSAYERTAAGTLTAGVIIFGGPLALAKFLTRPYAVRMLTDGLTAGTRSRAFARLSRSIVAINLATRKELAKMPNAQQEFYLNIQQLEPQEAANAQTQT